MTKLVTKGYDSRVVGSNWYTDILIDGSVLVYIPIIDYRAHIFIYYICYITILLYTTYTHICDVCITYVYYIYIYYIYYIYIWLIYYASGSDKTNLLSFDPSIGKSDMPSNLMSSSLTLNQFTLLTTWALHLTWAWPCEEHDLGKIDSDVFVVVFASLLFSQRVWLG